MKTNIKSSVIDFNDGRMTIYNMNPRVKELRNFRKEQMKLIPESERFFFAECTIENDPSAYAHLARSSTMDNPDDTFTSETLGFSPTLANPGEFITSGKFGIASHLLCIKAFCHCGSSKENEREIIKKEYLDDKSNHIPFRIINAFDNFGNVGQQYFVPCSDKYSSNTILCNGMNVLHISYLAYLEQLLRNNRIKILFERAKEDELTKILNLYSFKKAMTLNISTIESAESILQGVNNILYPDEDFIRKDNINKSFNQKLRNPLSADLEEQGLNDKPLVKALKARKII